MFIAAAGIEKKKRQKWKDNKNKPGKLSKTSQHGCDVFNFREIPQKSSCYYLLQLLWCIRATNHYIDLRHPF